MEQERDGSASGSMEVLIGWFRANEDANSRGRTGSGWDRFRIASFEGVKKNISQF